MGASHLAALQVVYWLGPMLLSRDCRRDDSLFKEPSAAAAGGTSGSDALTPAPSAPGLLSLLPDLMQLSKSMKISGFSGGALNLSFTDPLPLTGNSTVANISGDAVQSDMRSSPGSISIDVSHS